MPYVQSSTENPFGHTPWQTALYTTFGDFAWLKQPQNAVVREPADIAPRIRKPPELAAKQLGGVTIVGGSGRVLGTLGSQMRLGLDMTASEARFAGIWRMAGGGRTPPIAPIRVAGLDSSQMIPLDGGRAGLVTPVTTASGAVSTYTPGAPGAAGSPFSAAAVAQGTQANLWAIPPAGVDTSAPGLLDQVKAWLSGSMVAGIPNYWLAIGGGLLLAARSAKKGGRF